MEITRKECAEELIKLLNEESDPLDVKSFAESIGYNYSPLFGRKKRRARLIGEIVTMNVALIIVAVNRVFNNNDAKSIIDPFLFLANQSSFKVIEQEDPDYKEKNREHVAQYIEIFNKEDPGFSISRSFYANIGMRMDLNRGLAIADRFDETLNKAIDALKRMVLA